MRKFRQTILLSVLTLIMIGAQAPIRAQEGNWTHFRGNRLDGIASDTKVPVFWNDSTNILWKTKIRGKGWSSPVVYGNQVLFTCISAVPEPFVSTRILAKRFGKGMI